jgi:hypothetical protein
MQARAQQSRQGMGLAAALLQKHWVAVLLQVLVVVLVEQQRAVPPTALGEMMMAMICRLVRCWSSLDWWVLDEGGVKAALLFSGVY